MRSWKSSWKKEKERDRYRDLAGRNGEAAALLRQLEGLESGSFSF